MSYRRKKPLPSHQPQITDYAEVLPSEKASALCDNKKVLTKGAMKVFEGLKVSIPKDELDMTKVLNCSPISKRLKLESTTAFQFPKSDGQANLKTKILASDVCQKSPILNSGQKKLFERPVGNKLGLKCTKKKQTTLLNEVVEKKLHDVYDFEETQDNVDIFSGAAGTLPLYSSFRNKFKDKTVWDDQGDEDTEKKIGVAKSMTKKKCVIMGRIFKNAAKPKLDVPEMDSAELLEGFVNNCQTEEAPHKLTEEEMNIMFDQLLHGVDELDEQKNPDCVQCTTEEAVVIPAVKKQAVQRPKASRQKKRQRANSVDSDDEEFRIGKPTRKRSSRKNGQDDSGINLEQVS